jgi:transcriptional regulator GlxA family with amidase domain
MEVATIAHLMLSSLGNIPIKRVEGLLSDFAKGYATPKIDVRGAVIVVEEDHGAEIANAVARHLVLYVRRPGYQSQFSSLLETQARAGAPFAELLQWIRTHLETRLDVPALAARAGLSERSFYRKFVRATGQTPARIVENMRLDAARMLLAQSADLKSIAGKVGLQPTARFVAAFQRRFGVTPRLFRETHATGQRAKKHRRR